jgi:hypothetical protein
MAVPASELAETARAAGLFVQLEITSVDLHGGDAEEGHTARVTGTVVRVFGGDATLRGRAVRCLVPVLLEGDEPPASGTLWTKLEALRAAKVLEAVLSPAEDGSSFDVPYGMCTPLAAGTEAPVDDPRTWGAAEAEQQPRGGGSGKWIALVGAAAAVALGWWILRHA